MPDDFNQTGEGFERPSLQASEGILSPAVSLSYPCLEMIAGPGEGLIFPLKSGSSILGRSKEHLFRLEDTSVSRTHSQVSFQDGQVIIQDLGSRNGTYINGEKIAQGTDVVLKHLDQVQIGIYLFRLALKPVLDDERSGGVFSDSSSGSQTSKSGQTGVSGPSNYVAEPGISKNFQQKPAVLKNGNSADKEPSFQGDEEKKEPGALKGGEDSLGIVDKASEGLLDEQDSKEDLQEVKKNMALMVPGLSQIPEGTIGTRLKHLFFFLSAFSAVIGLLYLLYFRVEPDNNHENEKKDAPHLETKEVEEAIPLNPIPDPFLAEKSHENLETEGPAPPVNTTLVENQGTVSQVESAISSSPDVSSGFTVHTPALNTFLEITSSPTTARVTFLEKDLGATPLRANVSVEPGREYTIVAEFDLKDLHDKYEQKLTFKASAKNEVTPLAFNADLGVLKILKLPRTVTFYLEGYYVYDKLKSHPVKITDIVYGRPIYVPFGSYVIELREKARVGDSNTYVDEIRYRRDFEINAERKLVELTIADRDLQFFPARVQSDPSGSAIYVDGEKIGSTPFSGDIPLGSHELKLTHEGFFDYVGALDMRTNTPFETNIKLKTSKVGELINKAKGHRMAGQYQESINQLVSALKLEGSEREKAEVYLGLGESFYMLGNIQQAAGYFGQAKAHPDFYYRALLGSARAESSMGNKNKSLTLLVEVLLHDEKNSVLINEASALFKQLSPLKSVIYVRTEPQGATVYVNNREVEQKTPLILSDLGLGNYRLEIQKRGFKTEQVKKNLKLSEFVPVIVKLTPEQL